MSTQYDSLEAQSFVRHSRARGEGAGPLTEMMGGRLAADDAFTHLVVINFTQVLYPKNEGATWRQDCGINNDWQTSSPDVAKWPPFSQTPVHELSVPINPC